MNRSSVTIVAAAFAMLSLQSAKALHAEYFWNNDPGIDRATVIAVLDNDKDGYYDAIIPTDNLPAGINLFGVRVRYTSTWSATYTSLVWNTPAEGTDVVAAEYFYDADPGIGSATPLPELCGASEGVKTVSLPTTGLEAGLHLLGVRVKGAFGWSATYTSMVWNTPAEGTDVVAAEYFYDADPGIGSATPLPELCGASEGVKTVSLPTTGLEAGLHLLGVRVKGAFGWSATYTASVDIVDGEKLIITALEYCWNNEQEPGQGTPIAVQPAQAVELDGVELPFPEYDAAEYKLSFRAQAGGYWYTVYSTTFVNVPPTAIVLSKEKLEVEAFATDTLTANVEPEDAIFTDVRWSSSHPEIASVDADGIVTGVDKGEAVITAESVRYPEVKAECRVTVTDDFSSVRLDEAIGFAVAGTRGALLITNRTDMPVIIYNISGRCVRVCQGGDRHVALDAGVYVVKCGSRAVKAIVH